MTQITLYNAPQSTCSQRVRFVLHAKGLPFEDVRLDLFSGDQLKPEYLAINPNGVVPSIIHDGATIIDSSVIMEYLDEVFPEPAPLRPSTAVAIAHMRAMMRYIDEIPAAAIRVPSYNLAFLPHFQKMDDDAFVALANSKPMRKEFLLRMGRTGFPREEMDQALDKLARTVRRMDDWIAQSGGPYLMGRQLTLADIAVMPVIVRMDDVNLDSAWADRPAIGRWLECIRAEPAFGPTYYPGTQLTEKYPHLAELRRARRTRSAVEIDR